MKLNPKILFFTIFMSVQLYLSSVSAGTVKKHFYLLGGGGEPNGDTTIFDDNVKGLENFVNSSNWKTTVSFDGGHKETEQIIKSQLGKALNLGSFTKENYNRSITELIAKIKTGELKPGDQLMVVISTHGAKNSHEKTHQICLKNTEAKDLNTLVGCETVNLDRLEELANIASKKGIKLALIDMSCFSGNLLNINNDKVCMISATGRDQYGYPGKNEQFSGKFLHQFAPGKNLEDIFLKAREGGEQPDFPMISTNEGKLVNELIYQILVPYINYNTDDNSNFSKFYSEQLINIEEQFCSLNQKLELIEKILIQKKIMENANILLLQNEFTGFRDALTKYREYLKNYDEAVAGKSSIEKEVQSILERDHTSEENIWNKYDPYSFIAMDVNEAIKAIEDLKIEQGDKFNSDLLPYLKMLKTKKSIAEDVTSKLSESSKSKLKKYKDYAFERDNSKRLASKVSIEARKVYDSLYRTIKRENASNPCKDFIL